MPVLAPLAPAAAGVGGGTATLGGGGALLGGITAGQIATAGAIVLGGVALISIVDDYLDTPATETETQGIQDRAGAQSKEARERLRGCRDCIWCQINIQAQGEFVDGGGRPDQQGIGPYLVEGRTVTAREGTIIAGLTHQFAQSVASRRNFRQIESWGILARTIAYIQARPPAGLPPGEHRAGGLARYSRSIRYDIMVAGTINAFMTP